MPCEGCNRSWKRKVRFFCPVMSSMVHASRVLHPFPPFPVSTRTRIEDKPNEICMIWGTMVNLADMMKAFREFIKGFKPKYRVVHDRSLGLPTKVAPSLVAVKVLLYEGYLRKMCMIGEVNLNLDCENLRAFPPSQKLYEYFSSCSSNTFYNNNGSFCLFYFLNVRVARGILL